MKSEVQGVRRWGGVKPLPIPSHLPANGRKEIGEELKALRAQHHLSMYELARLAKVSAQSIANIEQARNSATTDMLERVCWVFGIRPAQLLAAADLRRGLLKIEVA